MKKTSLSLSLVLIMIVFSIIGCCGGKNSSFDTDTDTDTDLDEYSSIFERTTIESLNDSAIERNGPYKLKESVVVEGIKYTLDKWVATKIININYNQFIAQEGSEYLIVFLIVENVSSESKEIDVRHLRVYNDNKEHYSLSDVMKYLRAYDAYMYGYNILDTWDSFHPGVKNKVFIVFEVPYTKDYGFEIFPYVPIGGKYSIYSPEVFNLYYFEIIDV